MSGGTQDVTVYRVTRAYRWASLAAAELEVALMGLAGFAGLFVAPTTVPPGHLRIMAAVLGVSLVAAVPLAWRSTRPRTLAISAAGVAYDCRPFTLVSPWTNVRSIVVIGIGSRALGLRLERGSVRRESGRMRLEFHGASPWRNAGLAWDRTVPLQPFVLGDERDAVMEHIRRDAPALLSRPPVRDRVVTIRRLMDVPIGMLAMFVIGLLIAQGMIG